MNEQVDRLKQHLIAIDATVNGFASRIPEAARSAIQKDVTGALAIIVAAEVNFKNEIDRRGLPFAYKTQEVSDTDEKRQADLANIVWEQTGTERIFKYTGSDGIEHFHFQRKDGSMDWMSTGSVEIAVQARDGYDAEQALSETSTGATLTVTVNDGVGEEIAPGTQIITGDGSGTALPTAPQDGQQGAEQAQNAVDTAAAAATGTESKAASAKPVKAAKKQ